MLLHVPLYLISPLLVLYCRQVPFSKSLSSVYLMRRAPHVTRAVQGRAGGCLTRLVALVSLDLTWGWTWPFASRDFERSSFTDRDAVQALERMGDSIHGRLWMSRRKDECRMVAFGRNQYGRHMLCNRTYAQPCVALTYGVQREYTFELDVRERLGCRVFALDPTVNHKAELADGVYFLKWAAPSPAGVHEGVTNGVKQASGWVFMPPPLLANLVGVATHSQGIPVLKMDCEGCEYQVWDHVMTHDPRFFTRVDQVSLEVHLSIAIGASSTQNVLNYGRLLSLLHRSGHRLQFKDISHCSPPTEPPESLGAHPLFNKTRYMRLDKDGNPDGHCHNYLFARRRRVSAEQAKATLHKHHT
jgi:hypothetical protein